MDITSIAALSSELKMTEVSNQFQVKAIKGQGEQLEKVMSILFSNLSSTPEMAQDPSKGTNLNVMA
ncbi:MAG: hypothetical protein ACOX2O_02280 [Bdellovibrionota bacterium]|jgi:hypothetical protein